MAIVCCFSLLALGSRFCCPVCRLRRPVDDAKVKPDSVNDRQKLKGSSLTVRNIAELREVRHPLCAQLGTIWSKTGAEHAGWQT